MGCGKLVFIAQGFSEDKAFAAKPTKASKEAQTKISPALRKFLTALKEHGNPEGKPTDVLIVIKGKSEHAFHFKLDNLAEIQEILQWTTGQE